MSQNSKGAAKSQDILHLSQRHRVHENLRTFFTRFLELACNPRRYAILAIDCCLLVHSTWSGRQLGPDVVYPMLGIRKRHSERLASLILEYSRDDQSYELRGTATFTKGVDPPCVAIIDLDEVPPDVVENGYSTRVDLYGLMCMLMVFEAIVTLIIHVFYLQNYGWITWLNWSSAALVNLFFCWYAVFRGDGTLTLARRSGTSVPGCAVLLDQDFTVILNGSHNVVEAIAESSFNLSHDNFVWRLRLRAEEYGQGTASDILEALCEAVFLAFFALCWLLFQPSTALEGIAPMVVVVFIAWMLQRSAPEHFSPQQKAWLMLKGSWARGLPAIFILVLYDQVTIGSPLYALYWLIAVHSLSVSLLVLFSAGYRSRNYPIRTGKFLDALGHPPIRKWQFDTLAAAATFQCLVLCRGIDRPVKSINVLAFLDIIVPDQRDLWRVWKERVADRIVHEVDISFAPMIPTFRDERQRQLKDLLDQAQLGYRAYRSFCDRVPRRETYM